MPEVPSVAESQLNSPWVSELSHLALVVDDLDKAKWFFGNVLNCPFEVWCGCQIIVRMGPSLLVAKLSKDAVDAPRQLGEFGKQVLDHYGFRAATPEQVTLFADVVRAAGLEIVKGPYDRSDGRAVYFRDPFGNLVEYLWYAPFHKGQE
jgi:catechol 2,3-dioxygenase-like lactoylglutathione lyase family enzyme